MEHNGINLLSFFNSSGFYIIIGIFAVYIAKQWFTKFVNKKFDDLNDFQESSRKEREYDNYLTLRGQQVIADNLHELNYAVLNGTHNGGLEKANKELDKYRELVDENVSKKAAKWNIKIDL